MSQPEGFTPKRIPTKPQEWLLHDGHLSGRCGRPPAYPMDQACPGCVQIEVRPRFNPFELEDLCDADD